MSVNKVFTVMSLRFCKEFFRWYLSKTSFGFLSVSQSEVINMGNTIIPDTTIVQNKTDGRTIHAKSNKAVSAIGTRLRRILSNIFQRDNAEIGFLIKCFSGVLTHGKIQGKICQSPRIQRNRVFISAL